MRWENNFPRDSAYDDYLNDLNQFQICGLKVANDMDK